MAILDQILSHYPLLRKVSQNPNYKFSSKTYPSLIHEIISANREWHDKYQGREIGDLFGIIEQIKHNNPSITPQLTSIQQRAYDPSFSSQPTENESDEITFTEEEAEEEEEELNAPKTPKNTGKKVLRGTRVGVQNQGPSRDPSILLNKKINKIKDYIDNKTEKGEFVNPQIFSQLDKLTNNTNIPMTLGNRTSEMLGTIEAIKNNLKLKQIAPVNKEIIAKGKEIIEENHPFTNPVYQEAQTNYDNYLKTLNKELSGEPGTLGAIEQRNNRYKEKGLREITRSTSRSLEKIKNPEFFRTRINSINKEFGSKMEAAKTKYDELLATNKINSEQYQKAIQDLTARFENKRQETLLTHLPVWQEQEREKILKEEATNKRFLNEFVHSKTEEEKIKKGINTQRREQLKDANESTGLTVRQKIAQAREDLELNPYIIPVEASNQAINARIKKLSTLNELTKEQGNILANLAGNTNQRPNPQIASQPTLTTTDQLSLSHSSNPPISGGKKIIKKPQQKAKGGEIEELDKKIKKNEELREKISSISHKPLENAGIIERLSDFLTGGAYSQKKKEELIDPLKAELVNSLYAAKELGQSLKDKAYIKHLDQSDTIKTLHNQMKLQNLLSRFTSNESPKEVKKEEKEKFDRFYKIYDKPLKESKTRTQRLLSFLRTLEKTKESLKDINPGTFFARLPNFFGLNLTGKRGLLTQLFGQAGDTGKLEMYGKNLNELADEKLAFKKQAALTGRAIALNRESKLNEEAGKEEAYKEFHNLKKAGITDLKNEIKESKKILESYLKENPNDKTYAPLYEEITQIEQQIPKEYNEEIEAEIEE